MPVATEGNIEEIVDSFDPMYRQLFPKLPKAVWPQSSSHGQHSYTVLLGPYLDPHSLRVNSSSCPRTRVLHPQM